MLANVVDRRTNCYNVNCDAVFEPSWHDNTCHGASTFSSNRPDDFKYDEILNTTVAQAVKHATIKWDYPVTLYLYDVGLVHR